MKLKLLFPLFLLFVVTSGWSQTVMEGYIINIENDLIYIDLNETQLIPGEKIDVYDKGEDMIHPVTGKRISKEPGIIGTLEVGETFKEYSIARSYSPALLRQLKVGMKVRFPSLSASKGQSAHQPAAPLQSAESFGKIPIVIVPAVVNDVVNNGHFGGYVADILMEQMLLCDKVRLLDRSVLNAQFDEINLAGEVLDPSTTIQRAKGIGARYILQTTMQKPDVANIRTGVPLASIMGAIQGATGTNIGAGYASNMQIASLKAAVTISVRVVDLQTGEVVFMTSGNGEAKGKSQLSMEYGALGGGELNGGAEGFKQTVTGKAIQKAFRRIGRNLITFFNGDTDKKVLGSLSGGAVGLDGKMYAKGYKLYLGTEKLDKEGVSMAFSETPELFFKYKKAKRKKIWGWLLPVVGISFGVGVGGSSIRYDDSGTCAIVFGSLGLATAASGIVLYISGKKDVNAIVSQYNQKMAGEAYFTPKRKSKAYIAFSPTGIRLTF